jgi:hypothetical protein
MVLEVASMDTHAMRVEEGVVVLSADYMAWAATFS